MNGYVKKFSGKITMKKKKNYIYIYRKGINELLDFHGLFSDIKVNFYYYN